jgi:hypothetical protein
MFLHDDNIKHYIKQFERGELFIFIHIAVSISILFRMLHILFVLFFSILI